MKSLFSTLVTFILLSCVSFSYAQTYSDSPLSKPITGRTTLSVLFSFGGNDLYSSPDVVGGPSYYGKGFTGIEGNVSMLVIKNLAVVTGFTFAINKFEKTDAPSGSPVVTTRQNIVVLSIPLYVKYHFLKFLYVSAGPVFNMNSGDRDLNGVGVGGTFGAEYAFNNGLLLSFGPFIRFHGLLPEKNYKLINSGVNFGIGYRF